MKVTQPEIHFELSDRKILGAVFRTMRTMLSFDPILLKTMHIISGGSNVDLHHLTRAKTVIGMLRDEVSREVDIQADPAWVSKNKEAQDNGLVTIIADPVEAVKMLSDIRKHQITQLDAAETLIEEAGYLLSEALLRIKGE